MAHTSTTITAPVTTSDVATVLAVASHNVGYLCSNLHGKINKWAKFKPVRVDTPFSINDTQRKAVNQGLVVTSALTSAGAYNLVSWGYNAPDGTWWKRLGDFNGYSHTQKPPIYIISDEPDEDGCTVVTWDEGMTKIDDFKILAGYLCGSSTVGPPAQIGIRMDELSFGTTTNIANCTFGLLQIAGTVKMYLGASQKFGYGNGEAPACNFATKFSASSSGYNYLAQNLMSTPVGSYIEVLPVIDTMDFVANKVAAPSSGLTGFPVGKKLRIYHRKSEDWYLTGINGNISLTYLTNKDTGTTKACGTMYHSNISSGGINRELPADPDMQYYIISAQYNFYNNRNYAITLNKGSFYIVIGNAIVAECLDMKKATDTGSLVNSVSLAAKSTVTVVMRFRMTVAEFNSRFAPVTGLSTQPVQNARFNLAYINPHNLVTVKNSSGVAQTETWQFYFQVLK